MNKGYWIGLNCLLIFSITTFAQVTNHKTYVDYFAQQLDYTDPFQTFDIIDSVRLALHIDNKFTRTWLGRKLLNEHLLDKKGENYRVVINPLANFSLGQDNLEQDDQLFVSTRGVQIAGTLGDNFVFYTDVLENQLRYTSYLHQFVEENRVVPGQGFPKRFKETAWDFAQSNGFVAFKAGQFFQFQLGHGRHFLGEGYRSLLLSDNTFNYPYLKVDTKFWKIKYTNLFTQLLDVQGINIESQDPTRKYVHTHYLDMELLPKLHFALFETVVYHDDSTGSGFDISYLNPIIFYRPIEFATGSRNGNVILGLNASYQIAKNQLLYAQFSLDELKISEFFGGTGWWANKYGIQLGAKSYHTFVPNLFVQTEVNYVRPYTYTHNLTVHNYGHYNQPLAHPLGANFIESVSWLRYRHKRWFAETQFMYALQGRDFEDTNWGSDVYASYNSREQDYDNRLFQGNRTTTLFSDTKIGYLLNPSTNLRLELGYTYRRQTPEVEISDLEVHTTRFFYLGIVTRLQNHYYDF